MARVRRRRKRPTKRTVKIEATVKKRQIVRVQRQAGKHISQRLRSKNLATARSRSQGNVTNLTIHVPKQEPVDDTVKKSKNGTQPQTSGSSSSFVKRIAQTALPFVAGTALNTIGVPAPITSALTSAAQYAMRPTTIPEVPEPAPGPAPPPEPSSSWFSYINPLAASAAALAWMYRKARGSGMDYRGGFDAYTGLGRFSRSSQLPLGTILTRRVRHVRRRTKKVTLVPTRELMGLTNRGVRTLIKAPRDPMLAMLRQLAVNQPVPHPTGVPQRTLTAQPVPDLRTLPQVPLARIDEQEEEFLTPPGSPVRPVSPELGALDLPVLAPPAPPPLAELHPPVRDAPPPPPPPPPPIPVLPPLNQGIESAKGHPRDRLESLMDSMRDLDRPPLSQRLSLIQEIASTSKDRLKKIPPKVTILSPEAQMFVEIRQGQSRLRKTKPRDPLDFDTRPVTESKNPFDQFQAQLEKRRVHIADQHHQSSDEGEPVTWD